MADAPFAPGDELFAVIFEFQIVISSIVEFPSVPYDVPMAVPYVRNVDELVALIVAFTIARVPIVEIEPPALPVPIAAPFVNDVPSTMAFAIRR
jgi:hypothetical protein